jgi:hypothetical protein
MAKRQLLVGDKVILVKVTHTLGGRLEKMTPLIGRKFVVSLVKQYDPTRIRLRDDPLKYTWHENDFELLSDLAIDWKPPPKPPAPPKWLKPFPNNKRPSSAGQDTNFILYRPRRGEINARPLSWEQLMTRASKCAGVVKKYDTASWLGQACFAALKELPTRWNVKHRWNKKPPSWITVQIDINQNSYDANKLTRVEIIKWIKVLQAHNILGKEVNGGEYYDRGDFRMKLLSHSMRRLYMMLCPMRDCREHPWVIRQTLMLMKKKKLNFFVAFVISHFFGYGSVSSHSVFCSWEYGSKATAQDVLHSALQMEKYAYVTSLKEKPFVDTGNHRGFELQSTMKGIITTDEPTVTSFNDLIGMSLQHT